VILALEGNDGVGKSTAAALLNRKFGLFVFEDPVRHGALGDLDAGGLNQCGNQCNLDLAAFSRELNFVADRWLLSSYVYDALRGIPPNREVFEICSKVPAWIFLLECNCAVARERVISRDGTPRRTLGEMESIERGFQDAALLWTQCGGYVRYLSSESPQFERELIGAVEIALLHSGR